MTSPTPNPEPARRPVGQLATRLVAALFPAPRRLVPVRQPIVTPRTRRSR
ncbi:MAG TPA: hypothetical protein VF367_03840 [Candidatus Limnocylindria bacterium]